MYSKVLKLFKKYNKSFNKLDSENNTLLHLGIKSNSMIYHLATRFRHYNIGLLLFASQLFRGLPPVLRQNATAVIIGGPNPSDFEIDKMAEEYGQIYDGADNFKQLYKKATNKRYNFLYLFRD